MKKHNALFKTVLCLLAAVFLPTGVQAAGTSIPEAAVSLTITHAYDGVCLPDVLYQIYLVAVMDETGALKPLDRFSQYADRLTDSGASDGDWKELAQGLEQDILNAGTPAPTDSGVTDENGVVRFPSSQTHLTPGLYLVGGTRAKTEQYVYSTGPFLVPLPAWDPDSGTWNSAVEAKAKPEQSPLQEDFTVIKVWKDHCHPDRRPESITIQLLRDGENWGDPVTLPIDGEWKYTWKNLDTEHRWTVREDRQSGYLEPDIRQYGCTFVVTNSCAQPPVPTTPGKPRLPQTGQLWWPVPLLTAAGLLLILIGLIRRRRHTNAG